MKFFFKFSLAFVLLLVIAAVGFAIIFNPNDYKEDIINLVNEKSGRDLSIHGEISLSLFPWIGIDLGAIEISNAKGFGKQSFAKMSHLQVHAKFWPLLYQRLEADTVVIEGLKLNLTKNKHGITNWDDLTKDKPQAKAETITQSPSKTKKGSAKNILAAIALNGIKIKNAQFNWHDQQQKQKIIIKNVQLSLGKLKPETKIPLNLQFYLQEKSLDTKITFSSDILFSSNLQQFSFYDTQLTSDLKLASLKNRLSPQLNSALIQLNLEKQTFNTNKLTISESSLKLQTKVTAKQLFTKPYINSQIILSPFNPRALAKKLSVELPDMSDKKALTRLGAQIDIKGSLEKFDLTNIALLIDDTNIIANAKIKPTPDTSTVNLVVDNINLDRYLPSPAPIKKEAKTSKNKSKNVEAALIPVALLSLANVNADFKIKKLRIKKTHWNNLHLIAHSKNGHIQIKPLTLQGYAAKVQSDFKIKKLKNNAILSGNINIQNIKAGELLNDLTGKDKLKGLTSITANFNTSGIKLSQIKQNLNGKIKLKLQNGTLKGFDLHHQQNVLKAKLKRQAIPAAPVPEETKIANLSASAIIKNGILSNKDLRASTPLSRIAGRGTVNIVKEQLNYTASVKFTSSTEIKANTPYEKMKAIPLDIYIRGTFDKPDIKADFSKIPQQLIKREIKEYKIKDKTKKELKKKLGDKLKKLFKF